MMVPRLMRLATAALSIAGLLSYASAEFCQQLCDFYPACRLSKHSSYTKDNGVCAGFYHKDKGFCFKPTEGAACDDTTLRPVFAPNVRHQPGKVLIIYTGGTIGMQPFANGTLHPVPGYLTRQIHSLPELQATGMPTVSVVEWENLIDSSDMSPEGWAAMAKAVEDNYDDYDGFVILHGTDTMSYTSSALSFMFSNLAKSVIITGAAIPFFEPHSDARRNIVVSVLLAGSYNIPEVSLFSGTRLMRGTRCVKIQTSAAGSFASPKFPDLATIDSCVQLSNILRLPPTGPFRADKRMEGSLLVLRMVPGFANLKSMALSDVKGVVLVLYGSGNAPSNQPHFTDWLIKVREQDIPVIGVSQILRGAINLGSYLGGVHLFSLGVISARDMTVEAAVAKLSYLLGKGYDRDKVAVEFGRSLRGEISQAGDADADGLQYLKLDL